MSGCSQKKLIRCPVCFNSGIDVYLKRDMEMLRCLKCSYTGTLKDVEDMYEEFRGRYRWMGKRVNLEDQRKL